MRQASLGNILFGTYLVLAQFHIHARAGWEWEYCSADIYEMESAFESNLITLLDSLSGKAQTNGAFAVDSFGKGSDAVYGLIMCYVDYSLKECFNCLKNVSSYAQVKCRGSKSATVMYDECLLRYSSTDFRSQVDSNHTRCMFSDAGKLDSDSRDQLNKLFIQLGTVAPKDPQMVASQVARINRRNFTTLVQCTRDLSPDQCQMCIQSVLLGNFSECDKYNGESALGLRIMRGSCYLRYESNYSFEIHSFPVEASPPAAPAFAPAAAPAAVSSYAGGSKSKTVTIAISITVALIVAGLASAFCLRRMCRARKNDDDTACLQENVETELKYILKPNAEYQVFDYTTLKVATNDFSVMNKLGKGGFGSVYKGILPDGREIAVKRLSEGSVQGVKEFSNEVDSLAKLKHKNLVQLLGCCITKEEKLLCYEYLPNGSLDTIIFARNRSRRAELSWKLRYKIIEGICRGLHYLHEESILKIIHRDLKVGNILLDKDMNPKISDFGLARFFEEDQTNKETNVLVGTFGYMAPEYVLHGNFSVKSDVYSFGILLLEILTGQKNSSFVGSGRISNFIKHAFIHWSNDTILQLMDPVLEEECAEEIKRCVHIALLCVQENPTDRPTMANVRNMLGGPFLMRPDLPSISSVTEELHFPILEESSSTSSTNKSRAERSITKSMTSGSEG